MKRLILITIVGAAALLAVWPVSAAPKVEHKAWTDPAVALREDADFSIQGEYRSAEGAAPLGAQVVALGGGRFDVFILDGGLPGAGWEPGKSRTVLRGERKGDAIECGDASGKATATIARSALALTIDGGVKHQLTRIERRSPTLDAKPPASAVVLFDGTSADQWANGRVENGHLLATGCTSKQRFGSYTLHVEFRTPYMPTARGQQRGNSGVYHSGRWETQILDSFALEGRDNECGGIYSVSKPRLNMCLPPLAWQTYDVQFTAAQFDATGKRTAWPRITVRLNGVLVHDNLDLSKDFTTAAPFSKPLDSPEGPIFLQNHGNPVVFRNLWIVPDK
jgi:hypothetical protein